MTHVNCHIPTSMKIRQQQRASSLEHELEFWKAKADEMHSALENIYDHAKEHGRVELHRNGDKLVLCVEKPQGNTP